MGFICYGYSSVTTKLMA